MAILAIAARGAALVGKSACITAGVFIGTLAVGKGLELVGRINAGRDDGKGLADSIKAAFSNTAEAVKETATDTAAAVRKATEDMANAAAKEATEVAERAAAAQREADAKAAEADLPSTPLTFEDAIVMHRFMQLYKAADKNGYSGSQDQFRDRLDILFYDGRTRTLGELMDWAIGLNESIVILDGVKNYLDMAWRSAQAAGYGGTIEQLEEVLRGFLKHNHKTDPNAVLTVLDIGQWARQIGENDKREQESLEAHNRAEREAEDERVRAEAAALKPTAEVVIDQEAIDKRLGDKTIDIVLGASGNTGVVASELPAASASTGEAMAADLSTAPAPTAPEHVDLPTTPTVPAEAPAEAAAPTPADKAKVDSAIAQATKAAADKAAAKAEAKKVVQPGRADPKNGHSK